MYILSNKYTITMIENIGIENLSIKACCSLREVYVYKQLIQCHNVLNKDIETYLNLTITCYT